jgi:hypothetical protein
MVRPLAACLVFVAIFPLDAAAADPTPRASRPASKWRIEYDNTAKTAGTISFRVLPQGGTPIDLTVDVAAKQTENAVARTTRDAFKGALGKAYRVETDDGEDVLVKRGRGTPVFVLELVGSTVDGVRIDVEHD